MTVPNFNFLICTAEVFRVASSFLGGRIKLGAVCVALSIVPGAPCMPGKWWLLLDVPTWLSALPETEKVPTWAQEHAALVRVGCQAE
jgi:hypothetical protein